METGITLLIHFVKMC